MNTIVSEPLAERECPDEPQAGLKSSEFGELYTDHSRAIYYLCLRMLSDPESFSLQGGTCVFPLTLTLGANASCTIKLKFTPLFLHESM